MAKKQQSVNLKLKNVWPNEIHVCGVQLAVGATLEVVEDEKNTIEIRNLIRFKYVEVIQ